MKRGTKSALLSYSEKPSFLGMAQNGIDPISIWRRFATISEPPPGLISLFSYISSVHIMLRVVDIELSRWRDKEFILNYRF